MSSNNEFVDLDFLPGTVINSITNGDGNTVTTTRLYNPAYGTVESVFTVTPDDKLISINVSTVNANQSYSGTITFNNNGSLISSNFTGVANNGYIFTLCQNKDNNFGAIVHAIMGTKNFDLSDVMNASTFLFDLKLLTGNSVTIFTDFSDPMNNFHGVLPFTIESTQ